jgi:MFS family permease
MSTSTRALYWRLLGGGALVGVVLAVAGLNLYYLATSTEYFAPSTGYGPQSFYNAVRWGTFLALVTAAFVMIGTLAVAGRLNTAWGKAGFVLLSIIGPAAGWMLFGVVQSVLTSWHFFFFSPILAVFAGIFSGIVAAFATFFIPERESEQAETDDEEDLLRGLGVEEH